MLNQLSLLDLFLRGTLMTTNKFVVIFIILLGYNFLKKDIFGRTFVIFAFAMILNAFLKSLFQIPLPPGLTGWGFPSGHMFASSILWGWLCWEYKNKYLYIFSSILLICVGIALVHFGYHYPSDVIGALLFVIPTLFLYHLSFKFPALKKNPPLIGFALALLGLILIAFIPNVTRVSFVWIALMSLLGFSLGWFLNNKFFQEINFLNFKTKFIIFLFSIFGLSILESIYFLTRTTVWSITFIHYFIIALWLTLLAEAIIMYFLKKTNRENKYCNYININS